MSSGSKITDWTNGLAQNADIFPHQLDLVKDQVLLVRLSAQERIAASFLDQRILTANTHGMWVPWQALADELGSKSAPQPVNPAKPTHYIFHVGHCGSTLLSRLFEFVPNLESLREPLILRTLAQDIADNHEGRSFLSAAEHTKRLHQLSTLWNRGAQHTVVKATSICTDLMPQVLNANSASKSIFIYNTPQSQLETLLAGQNNLVDMKNFAQLRIQRLRQLTGLDIRLEQLSLGQLSALSWLSEVTRAAASMAAYSSQNELASHNKQASQLKKVNFDVLLKHPQETLADLFEFMDVGATAENARSAIASPVMRTYSKAPEYEYSADLRSQVLAEARERYRGEISDGLRWIEQLAQQSDLVAQAIQLFER